MKQYKDLLRKILDKGTTKPPARENMPSTTSLFGHQMEFDLSKGFPILTTKKIVFKNIVTELLWFLRGDTNIKYLNEHGFKMWNEDSYNYYKKTVLNYDLSFEEFIEQIKAAVPFEGRSHHLYNLGDCGYQYGKVWRDFNGTDQILRVFNNLQTNPEGRRHVVTAVDPANDDNLALYWCHSLFQFNARPLSRFEQMQWGERPENMIVNEEDFPKYALDLQMYQRSADVFLGVPYNISSYSLLTFLFAKLLNMLPGRYIHTFGDVHIYSDHMDQVNQVLANEPKTLPTLKFTDRFENYFRRFTGEERVNGAVDLGYYQDFDNFIQALDPSDIELENYKHHKYIPAKLSTGLK